ncbi:ankyrin repeat and LEM domain-containing protein 1 [Mixophyes fleayi]|uniref:ankyrin repeat and LEM domain-containing protein 1 n=1 Tax=Mixophyes fleayi TaxID=3061075 RepID=UPI003F4DDF61
MAALTLARKLCEAVENEDAKEVENLLKCEADPNLVLPNGIAAVHLASGKESESALRCLTMILQQGGDPNVRSMEALTPVHVAASWGCCKALIFLLRKGGDPTLQDQDGNTALDMALMENNRRCVVALQEYTERSLDDYSDQNHGYCKNVSCLTDNITEMSSITHLLESSYDNSPFNSTKISPFMSPRYVTPGKGMNDAVISSQIELSSLDTKVNSRKKHEISTGIKHSKVHLSANKEALNAHNCELKQTKSKGDSVTWMLQPAHCCEDFSMRWQSDIIDVDNPPINTEIEQPTLSINACTLLASHFSDDNSNKVRKEISLSPHPSNQADSAFKNIFNTKEESVLNHTHNLSQTLIIDRWDVTSPDYAYNIGQSNNDVAGGGNCDEQEVSYSSKYNSCQSASYTSIWDNSYCSDKRGWVPDVIGKPFLSSHCNQVCSNAREDAMLCSQKHSYNHSELEIIETLPERKEDMLVKGNKGLTGLRTQLIDGHKEGTDKEHNASFKSETQTDDHESKISGTSGILYTSQSPTLSVGGANYDENDSQDLKINVRNLMLLTKGCRLNLSQQDRHTLQGFPVAEAEASCFDTVPVSVISEAKTLVEHDLTINQNLKDGSSSFSNTSADMLISESDELNLKEKADAELCDGLRKMMLATKAFQFPTIMNVEKSPCFFTPRSKSRLLSSKSRHKDSSLFEDSVEMPTRGRSPGGMLDSPLQPCELGPRKSFCPTSVLFEQNHVSNTSRRLNKEDQNLSPLTSTNQTPESLGEILSEQETTVNITNFLTDDLSSSEAEIKSSVQLKQTTCAEGEIFESEWLTEDGESESIGESDYKNTVIGSAIEGKPLSLSLANGSFLHSTATEDTAANCTKVPRYSFSRLSCVAKTNDSALKSCHSSTIYDSCSQKVPLSPGGRPVNVSQVEPMEYLYMDNEKGHALIERHIPCKDQSAANISENVDNTILYDWRNYKNSNHIINKVSSAHSPDRVAVELYRLSNDELTRRLRELGEDSRQVTSQNRKTCILLLDKRLKEQVKSGRAGVSSAYSPELSIALRTFNIPDCNSDEATLSLEFDQPDKTRKWREGVLKSSFNYLLLDPRVTCNLPSRHHNTSKHDCFCTFVRAVFYVGKGKRSRPYSHLYEALTYYKGSSKQPCPKVQHIIDIWRSGQGVLSLHCFQNTIPVEAYTREACMVDAIGLKMLTNQKKGVYYGQAQNWPPTRRRCLGVHMLHRAMQIFLAEGERQLRPPDIRNRP